MDTFSASSDRERGFRIPWYAAVPAVGSLGLAALSLSRLKKTRMLFDAAAEHKEILDIIAKDTEKSLAAKNRLGQMVDAMNNIFEIDLKHGYGHPAATPFVKKFLALGGKIHQRPDGKFYFVPIKTGEHRNPKWLLDRVNEDLAELGREKQLYQSWLSEELSGINAQKARITGSVALGIPAAAGMLYGNRGNWRSDKTSSLRVPSDKLSAMYQYDATTGEVVGVDIADPKDPSKVITPTIRQLAKQGYPEFKGLLELDRAAGRQTYADYLASGGRYRIKFPDAESVSGGSGFFDITPGKGALGGAALGMLLGGLYADKVNNNPLQSQTQRNQAALGCRALGATGGALGGYLLGKALSD